MRKKLYKLHRTLSVIIAVPVLLWASSGFMHPIMTNIRPRVATQGLAPVPIDTSKLRVSLPEALRKNHIGNIAGVRMVHIDTNWFYQVSLAANQPPVYLATLNGRSLPAGDWIYAQYLARQFLRGQENTPGSHAMPPVTESGSAPAADARASFPADPRIAGPTDERPARKAGSGTLSRPVSQILLPARAQLASVDAQPSGMHDCCNNATDHVINDTSGARVSNASLLTAFDEEYKSINRLLPVYRVSFDRPDGIRIYVETGQDRFAFAMDNKRAVFDTIFRIFHTWSWLDGLGRVRLLVIALIAFLALMTSLMGISLFFSTNSKPVKGNSFVRARRNHRYTAVAISLFTLFWTFSGCYHALSQLKEDTRNQYFAGEKYPSADVLPDFQKMAAAVNGPLVNIGLARMNGKSYWQVYTLPPGGPALHSPVSGSSGGNGPGKDLMKDGKSPLPPVTYLGLEDYAPLTDGDRQYAAWLATRFSQQPPASILSVSPVTRFDDEYNFTDKRLPVWKVSYPSAGHERYYIETSTGRLSVRVDDADMREGYSFALFHKHHFMDGAGKEWRDVSTMFWALAQVFVVALGLTLYFKWRSRAVSGKKA